MIYYKNIVNKISIPNTKKTKQKEYLETGNLPIIDQGKVLVGGYSNDVSNMLDCKLPVIIFGDHTKCVKLINFPFGAGADGIKVLQPKEGLSASFLYYATYYLTFLIEDKGYARHYQQIEKCKVSIPLPSEQISLVNRIEELFSELDKGVETLMTIKKQLEVYRQAVLKEAFSQIENKKKIREMSCFVTSGSRGWAKYYSDQGSLFIRIGNLTHTTIDIILDETQYVKLPEKAEGIRSRLQPNDILVSITADLGSIGLVPENIEEAYINQHIAMIRLKNPSQGKLVAWYLRSEYGQKDLLKNKRGAGKFGLGLDDIRNSEVPNISEHEAVLIVKKIEMQLSVCDRISHTINTAFGQADAMRKSILKHTFEGTLSL
ncbi:hypothetical protein [Sphaerochaeta sp. S2]|uniref:hypothetical protein n=1 Tax=Sphaerochaeta sp. S2 TaxID=2798868 RepID=UPI0018EA301B|nr:hypothetical protein [Sphaerochaeta sp. S2]MBJ2357510.1 hypothetical protein [Sphaerochaeta sp. S2]